MNATISSHDNGHGRGEMSKRRTKFKPYLAAAVLLDAAYTDDKSAAARHGVTERSIANWRNRLGEDAEFSAIFQRKRELAESRWADDAYIAMQQCIAFIHRAANEGDTKDPAMVHSIAGALKIVFDATSGKKLIDARLAAILRETRKATEPLAAEAGDSADHDA